jgi:NADH:ubiquinone oxidoreductase subunit E
MATKVEVRICFGTLCHVMGGAALDMLEELMPHQWKDLVDIKGANCLEACNTSSDQKPPFVEIDGTLYDQATLAKVMQIIKHQLENGIH